MVGAEPIWSVLIGEMPGYRSSCHGWLAQSLDHEPGMVGT